MDGTLNRSGLIAIMRSIAGRRLDGLLAVQSEHDLISITFRRGAVVAADAMNESMEDVLGEVLAREGLLAPAEFRRVVVPIQGSGRLPGEVLLQEGLVERGALLGAVRQQIMRQAAPLLRWQEGEYTWSQGAESPYHEGIEPISVAELLVEASSETGDPGFWPRLDQRYAQVGGQQASIRVVGRDGDWIEPESGAVWLLPVEFELLRRFESPCKLGELAAGDPDPETRYGFRVLLESGLLVPTAQESEPTAMASDVLSTSEVERAPQLAWDSPLESFELKAFEQEERNLSGGSEEVLLGGEWWPEEPRRKPLAGPGYLHLMLVWLSRCLSVGLMVGLCWSVVILRNSSSVWLPYFWQESSRAELLASQRAALDQRVQDAVRAFHLVYGRYPDEIGLLVDLGLLDRGDLHDLEGRFLTLGTDGEGYRLGFRSPDGSGSPRQVTVPVVDDYFLDKSFLSLLAPGREHPVVVLE